jgi:VanZ family protein
MMRRLLIWLLFVVAWTASLLTPLPDDDRPDDHPVVRAKFYSTKSLHAVGYAVMTILSGGLRAPLRWRLLLLFFVMAHAGVTEQLQTYIPGRTGRVRDVCLDHLGVLVGLVLSWKWWTEGRSS